MQTAHHRSATAWLGSLLLASAASGLLFGAAGDASAQSASYMDLMRSQNVQMLNRARIYSNVRSGARITRYDAARRPNARGLERARRSGAPAWRIAKTSPISTSSLARPTTFHAIAASIMPKEMAAKLARSPAKRAEIETAFNAWLTFYHGRVRERGKPANDVARAATYLVNASYMAYFDIELTQAHYDAVYEDMRAIYAADSRFQRAPDGERQKMFESYAIVAIMITEGMGDAKAKGDQGKIRHWREMARVNWVNLLGIPPEQVRVTLKGIEYRS